MVFKIDLKTVLSALCADMGLPSLSIQYLLKRLESEGLSFVTETLPLLATVLLDGLETRVLKFKELGCTHFRLKGSAPVFLHGLTKLVFDSCGHLRSDPCPVAIYAIRQVSQYFFKLALEMTDEQEQLATEKFILTENSIAHVPVNDAFVDSLRRNVESFYSFPSYTEVLRRYRPRCGPGTFAGHTTYPTPFYRTKLSSGELGRIPSRFKAYSGYIRPYPSCPAPIKARQRDSSRTSEVLFVPKDSRGPRTITREPLSALKFQMAFFDWFSSFLERGSRYRINFADQSVNRKLAEQGSITGEWSTLDLREASDRVSYSLVRTICRHIPVLRFFLKFRTPEARLPDGSTIALRKLAGMGSGLTFPWLALITQAAIATGISSSYGIAFGKAQDMVFVYGDDVVVPTRYAQCASNSLARVGLTVNTAKSFTRTAYGARGYFRESCGGDYFNGNDVSIVRLKLQSCELRPSGTDLYVHGDSALNQLNAHARECRKNGLVKLAAYYYSLLRANVGSLPKYSGNTSIIGEWVYSVEYTPDDTGTYPLVRALQPRSRVEDTPEQSPYFGLGQALKPSVEGALDYLDGDSTQYDSDVISVPRSCTYRRVRVSALSLMG